MAYIPQKVKKLALIQSMIQFLLSQGKVGDKYAYPGMENLLVSVRSGRLSVFDFVLLLSVLYKGEVLTALTDFWAREILDPLGIPHHLARSQKFPGRNMAKDLQCDFPEVDLTRTLVIQKSKIIDTEFIFRGHLGGSVWNDYLATGIVAGIKLPAGLQKWQKLDEPIFTPSTKAEKGHDINYTAADFFAKYGKEGRRLVDMLMELYKETCSWAEMRGILILDTKFESDGIKVCDEWMTPDSSRLVSATNFTEAMAKGIEPDFQDKQPARDYCAKIETPFFDKDGEPIVGFKKLDPTNMEHLEYVASLELPENVGLDMTGRYCGICQDITGMNLQDYQEKYLL